MGSPFVHELIKAYPNVKVVVVQREFDSWWPSFTSQLLDTLFNPLVSVIGFLDWHINGVRAAYAMRKVHFGLFAATNRKEIEANSRKAYDDYYDTIRRMVPPGRRLEYRMGDGWEPLCTLLGEDVPNVPFPRLNERKEHSEGVLARQNETVRNTTKKVGSWVF
ncbi:hypothetical protein RRF57_002247 [Xylaria bambusicola]|uniref:Uncharacterized protein n=1 Tax=Xylaria bambusicola TaxID=326684 RepID=A0AAN7UF02_9PEZI